jgi:asparagine synthase (glutamine-hydrolysing)
MFAFAVWDCHEQKLYLARDRLGEKPLYYGWLAGGLSFASEISALKVRFSSQPAVNQEALASYLQFGRVPSPLSIYEGIYKLPPGAWICFTRAEANAQPIDFSPAPESGLLKPTRYWDPREKALAAFQQPRIE